MIYRKRYDILGSEVLVENGKTVSFNAGRRVHKYDLTEIYDEQKHINKIARQILVVQLLEEGIKEALEGLNSGECTTLNGNEIKIKFPLLARIDFQHLRTIGLEKVTLVYLDVQKENDDEGTGIKVVIENGNYKICSPQLLTREYIEEDIIQMNNVIKWFKSEFIELRRKFFNETILGVIEDSIRNGVIEIRKEEE